MPNADLDAICRSLPRYGCFAPPPALMLGRSLYGATRLHQRLPVLRPDRRVQRATTFPGSQGDFLSTQAALVCPVGRSTHNNKYFCFLTSVFLVLSPIALFLDG